MQQQPAQPLQARLVAIPHPVDPLMDAAGVVGLGYLHRHRLAHQRRGHGAHGVGEGGAEQQRLARRRGLGDDRLEARLEAHVEHAVRFIQHQGLEPVECERALAQVLLDPARGAHHDMRAVGQGGELGTEGGATAQSQHLDVGQGARQPAQLAGHLVGELPGRAEDEPLHAEAGQVQP